MELLAFHVMQNARKSRKGFRHLCWQISLPLLSPSVTKPSLLTCTRACATLSALQAQTRSRLFLPNASQTNHLGRLLGDGTEPGDAILLSGTLGAGKTSFARGFIQAARRDLSLQVTSPTYLLANSYPPLQEGDTAPTVVHMDLWRLDDATKRPIVDFQQVFTDCASLIEWPDRLRSLTPPERLELLLEYPEIQGLKEDEDDPWGFGNGDPDGIDIARDGRFASLIPFGDRWVEVVHQLYTEFARTDGDGQTVLMDG